MHPETEQTAGPDPIAERIRALVQEIVEGSPLFLVDLQVRGRPGSRVVDVFIDSDEPLGVDTLAEVSRELSFLLDAEDFIKGRYHLNVSSPGVDRPLSLPRQYRKNIGRALGVYYRTEAEDAPRELRGVLVAADEEAITLEEDDGPTHRIPYSAITRANVLLPW
ncbi:MAG: ribosome maturation factor RimP [Bacteroidetes bacterium]|nr:ribosome maturation factor RimP [Rhodothermaceae bacterium RA]RMH66589.1 MAG: ribosome maturation factor RimP [Bacteroidota bacterium]